MRKSVRPFVVYRKGSGSYFFVPRGLNGWLQTAIWAAVPVPVIMWLLDLAAFYGEESEFWGGFLSVCFVVFWVIAGLWWVGAHADVIDYVEVKRAKQKQRRRLTDPRDEA